MHPKCIRNASQIYPKFNLFSLHLSHSNTIKIKTSIHISPYITYIYPKFIPNSTFSPYISVNLLSLYLSHSSTQVFSLHKCKNPKIQPSLPQMHQKCFPNQNSIQIFPNASEMLIPNLSQIQPSLPTSQSFKYCKY